MSQEGRGTFSGRIPTDLSQIPGFTVEEYDAERERMTLNMGPQHPSTHGVLRVIVEFDGERVVQAQPDVGYLHRNWEKIAEGWSYPKLIPFADRNDYLAPITNEFVLCLAIERLLGVEVPERAEYIRVILAEINRIASHLLWFGTFALDLGAVSPFLYTFREREMAYDIFEACAGARLLPGYFRIGGLRNDVPANFAEMVTGFCDQVEKNGWPSYYDLLFENAIFERRTRGIGRLSAEEAIAWGASGPVLRGSGVNWDLRRNEPYSVYDRFDFEVCVEPDGDCYARAKVRLREIRESIRIIRQALEQLPDGPVMGKVPKVIKVPKGDIYTRVESPRGEVGVYLVADGGTNPYRVKWRAPSFVHLQLLPELTRGGLVGDIVANIGSIDIVLGEVDR